jgi:phosphoribosyl-ATP pyrophosphohydrolase
MDGHQLSRNQIARHGVDRYPAVKQQLEKVAGELIELAMAIGQEDRTRIRAEYADVGLALYALGSKLGLDLIECMTELVEADTRDFRQVSA